MKTVKCYICDCGEDIYEDDEECCNCLKPVDQALFKEEEIPEITSQGEIKIIETTLELNWEKVIGHIKEIKNPD